MTPKIKIGEIIDITDDILKALRWIRDKGNIYGAVAYEDFLAQGLQRSPQGYSVPLPEGSVRVTVPPNTVGISISLTSAGIMILDMVDRAQKRALPEDPK